MNNYHKTAVILGVIVVVSAGLWLYYGAYKNIQAKFLEERKSDVSAFIQNKANQLGVLDDFNSADTVKQNEVFKSFFENIQSTEIFRVKVFSRGYKIIWSNLKEIIGQDASSNQDVKEALTNGKITLKTKSVKPEQVTERRFQNFTETYVPIKNEQGEYVGVIEIYQTYAALGEKINKEFLNTAIKVTAGVLIIFGILVLILRRLMAHQA